MTEVYVKVNELPSWLVKKYFDEKDFYSIAELIAIIEDLDSDKERLEEELEDLKRDLQDNYKPISSEEMYGIDDRDFLC